MNGSENAQRQWVTADALFLRHGAGTVQPAAMDRERAAIEQASVAGRSVVVRVARGGYEALDGAAFYAALVEAGHRDIPVAVVNADELTAIRWLIAGDGMRRSWRDMETLADQGDTALAAQFGRQLSAAAVAEEVGVNGSTVQKARDRRQVRARVGEDRYPASTAEVDQIPQRDLPWWCGRETTEQYNDKKRQDLIRNIFRDFEKLRALDRAHRVEAVAGLLEKLSAQEQSAAISRIQTDQPAGTEPNAPDARATAGSQTAQVSHRPHLSQASSASHRGRRHREKQPKDQIGLDYERVQKLKSKGDFKELERRTGIDKKRVSESMRGYRPAEDSLILAAEEKYDTPLRMNDVNGT